jgi:alpha-tubulin suppressor-like RCC1 family protein
VSCGFEHVLILTSQLDVISCGNNKFGQCGFDPAECGQTDQPFKITGLDAHEIVQVSAGSKHSLFLSSEGKVFAAGSNTEFQIGVGLDLD